MYIPQDIIIGWPYPFMFEQAMGKQVVGIKEINYSGTYYIVHSILPPLNILAKPYGKKTAAMKDII